MLGAVGVRSVDGGVGRHEPEPVTDEQDARHRAHDLGGFPEDELHELRVLLGDLGQLPGPRLTARGPEIDGAALRLRHDLARDHDDVAGLRLEPGLREEADHHRREVVAGLHHRDPGNADERDGGQRPSPKCSNSDSGLALRAITIYRDSIHTDVNLHGRTLVREKELQRMRDEKHGRVVRRRRPEATPRDGARSRPRGTWPGPNAPRRYPHRVLAVLSDGPGHGYDVIQRLEDKTEGSWRPSPGSVYPMLQLLADEGLARSVERDGKRVYELTDAGRAETAATDRGCRRHAVGAGEPLRLELRRAARQRAAAPPGRSPGGGLRAAGAGRARGRDRARRAQAALRPPRRGLAPRRAKSWS